jgi:threonine aldolase
MAGLRALCDEHGVHLHVDGARIFNAAVALGVDVSELSGPADSVSVCLSKGLSAPVGGLLAGSAEFVTRARRARKLLGGAMRQAGVIAAAGIYALEHNVERLADDHARARRLAEGWEAAGVPVDLDLVETNFVQVDAGALGLTTAEAISLLMQAGVGLSATVKPGVLRAVTHLDIGDDDVERALELVPGALGVSDRPRSRTR